MKAQTRGGSIPRILSGILSSPITPSLIGHERDDKYLCCFFSRTGAGGTDETLRNFHL